MEHTANFGLCQNRAHTKSELNHRKCVQEFLRSNTFCSSCAILESQDKRKWTMVVTTPVASSMHTFTTQLQVNYIIPTCLQYCYSQGKSMN